MEDLMKGKVRTDRSIDLAVIVNGSPEGLFELWSTTEGVNTFFGSGSTIESNLGGLYEVYFGVRPDGQVAGPRGTRILRYEPGQALDFEWEMPYFARELNTRPLPTWVEVRFARFPDEPEQTRVRVTHHGFGRGETWDRVYDFFQHNWFDILFRLKLHCTFSGS
jgi:uncharacterized protein YndB with AHSA1/START domain